METSGAISAYTSALELDPEEMVSSLSNRAACYLRIAELRECVDDCTAALELRRIEAPAIDVATEVKLLVRRGTALCQQGSFEASLADYRTATTPTATTPHSLRTWSA